MTFECVETPKQLAARVGVSEYQIKKLIEADQLEHVLIVKRVHIPPGAWERFIEANKRGGKACPDETRVPVSVGSTSASVMNEAKMGAPATLVDTLPLWRTERAVAERVVLKAE